MFEGELSIGEYDIHEISVFPDKGGRVIQGFNGEESWVTLDGKLVDEAEARKMSDIMRKKNLYWFSMMPKLLDSGVKYNYAGMRNVDNKGYNIVEITFDDHVGDTSDKFVLYINSKTHLVDQLLFTMKVFDREEPMLMKLEYEEVSGVKLPVKRRYTKSNWNGEILDDNWTEEIMTDIKFNNGLDKSDFNKPS